MTLEIDNIALSFKGKKVLYGIYLKATKGQVCGILGRNGCGKTSLLKIIFGALRGQHQHIRIDGKTKPHKLFKSLSIAYLPQHGLLPKNLRLKTAFKLYQCCPTAFLEHFPSFKVFDNPKMSALSSGEQKVVETYLTLKSNRPIILLDEPFSFVAPIYVDTIKKLIRTQKEERAIIITDHFYHDILEVSDTVYLIKNRCSKLINHKTELENEGYLLQPNATV